MEDETNKTMDKANVKTPTILLISGSPRSHACEELCALIERGIKQGGGKTQHFYLSQKHINPCVGCGSCEKTGVCVQEADAKDDYVELKDMLASVDAIAIVAPLYFAGPPAQLKALYDRFQPEWARRYVLNEIAPEKRPARLYIIGGGGDKHGSEPLVGISKSALNIAGFNVESVHDYIGFKAEEDAPKLPSGVDPNERIYSVRNAEKNEAAHDASALADSAADDASREEAARIMRLRQAVKAQRDFEERAVDAGRAFARYLLK